MNRGIMHRVWRVVLPAALVVLAACSKVTPDFRNTALEGVKWGKDFTLTSQTGARLNTADLRGKVLVLFFGYTHCPDICAPTVAKLAQAVEALGEDGKRVQILFVSVDPEHDTSAQLQHFVAGFGPNVTGLTGSSDDIGAIAADHMVYFKQTNGGARVEHTGMIFVKDVHGRMRLLIKDSAPLDDIVHDLRLLLQE